MGLQFPEQLIVKLVSDSDQRPLANIATWVQLHAPRKNGYTLGPKVTDINGSALFTRKEAELEVERSMHFFLMDHACLLNECDETIRIEVPSSEQVTAAVQAHHNYKEAMGISLDTILTLERVENGRIQPTAQAVCLDKTTPLVEVGIRVLVKDQRP